MGQERERMVRVTFRIPVEVMEWLERQAQRERRPVADVLVDGLWDYLERAGYQRHRLEQRHQWLTSEDIQWLP